MSKIYKISWINYIVIFCLSIVLSWKLFRFNSHFDYLWQLHSYFTVLFLIVSVVVGLKYKFYLNKLRMPLLILLFVGVSLFRLFYFQTLDAFTMCSVIFGHYFIIIWFFNRKISGLGFKYFELLLLLCASWNLLDMVDMNSDIVNIFNYNIPEFKIGFMTPLGHESQFIWSTSPSNGTIIRSPGISGTNYSSSALIAATSMYFWVLKKPLIYIPLIALLCIWGVGSSIAALIVCFLIQKRKSKWIVLGLLCASILVYGLFLSRGWDPSSLFNIINNFNDADLLVASFLGEGQSISSMHSEFRILGLVLSLGIIGSFLILCMQYNYLTYVGNIKLNDVQRHQASGGFYFILTLVIANFHYNTFFVYPNIFFFVMIIAISSVELIKKNAISKSTYVC